MRTRRGTVLGSTLTLLAVPVLAACSGNAEDDVRSAAEAFLADWAAGDTEEAKLVGDGPQVLLGVDGCAVLEAGGNSGGRRLELNRGGAAWVAAADPPVTVRGAGEACRVFRATTGVTTGGPDRVG